MFKSRKKIVLLIVFSLLWLGVINVKASAGWVAESLTSQSPSTVQLPPIQVYVNGYLMNFDVNPVLVNGRTMVPLRAILETLGATVTWDNSSHTVTASKVATTITLTIGSLTPTINGQVQSLDVPAQIVNGRILAPLRFVGEALGGKASWNGENQIINVYCPSDPGDKITAVSISVSASDVNTYGETIRTVFLPEVDSALEKIKPRTSGQNDYQ